MPLHETAVTNQSKSHVAAMPVHQDVFDAIAVLNAVLRRHYGCDFAYTIMGYGNMIAASNYKDGVIPPRTVDGV